MNIETGELLFEWSSLDHVTPDGQSYSTTTYDASTNTIQRLFCLSIRDRLDPATTPPMLGIISTSTASTRTLRGTISSPQGMPALYTRSTARMVQSSGVWMARTHPLPWAKVSLSASSTTHASTPNSKPSKTGTTLRSSRYMTTLPTAQRTAEAAKCILRRPAAERSSS